MDDAGICSGKWETVQRTEPHAGTECQVLFLFVYPPQPPNRPAVSFAGPASPLWAETSGKAKQGGEEVRRRRKKEKRGDGREAS